MRTIYTSRNGKLEHRSFIDLSGNDPSKSFAEEASSPVCELGLVFAYNAGFETARIKKLRTVSRLKRSLLAINDRVVDLLRVAEQRHHHPSQEGSWSIKYVLPAITDIDHHDLDGVQDGGMAANAYLEAISAKTTQARKAEIEQQLLKYCGLDSYGMVSSGVVEVIWRLTFMPKRPDALETVHLTLEIAAAHSAQPQGLVLELLEQLAASGVVCYIYHSAPVGKRRQARIFELSVTTGTSPTVTAGRNERRA